MSCARMRGQPACEASLQNSSDSLSGETGRSRAYHGPALTERAAWAEMQASAEFTAATAMAERAGLQVALNPVWPQPGSNPNRACLERLARGWMGLFSPDGTTYTALARTLMNVPGGVPPRTLARLVGIRLERLVTDRTVLLALLTAPCALRGTMEMTPWAQDGTRGDDGQLTRMLQHATREQVSRAVQIAGAAMHRPLSARRVADIADAMSWACDYPGEHHGTVVGLARKSARWHREKMQAEAAKAIEQLGGDRKTTVPPVPLPGAEGVEFLGTVARVADEGAQMNHCAASYAKAAVAGRCYLLHVEHGGEHATAEVSPQGEVWQVHGPGNQDNGACRYGRRVLARWGRQFREVPADLPEPPPELPAPARRGRRRMACPRSTGAMRRYRHGRSDRRPPPDQFGHGSGDGRDGQIRGTS
jgi:hypothetical protein